MFAIFLFNRWVIRWSMFLATDASLLFHHGAQEWLAENDCVSHWRFWSLLPVARFRSKRCVFFSNATITTACFTILSHLSPCRWLMVAIQWYSQASQKWSHESTWETRIKFPTEIFPLQPRQTSTYHWPNRHFQLQMVATHILEAQDLHLRGSRGGPPEWRWGAAQAIDPLLLRRFPTGS